MRLLTHIRPHLDEVCAIWLMRRYWPGATEVPVEFISAAATDAIDDEAIALGVGRGRFDEHKGDVNDCAASLLLAELRQRKLVPAGDLPAVERLVEWVRLEDTGQLQRLDRREFSVPVILDRHFTISSGRSEAIVELGLTLVEALFAEQRNQVALEADWAARVEFESVLGPAVALRTDCGGVDSFAFRHGFSLVIWVNGDRTYHNLRAAADSDVDLEPIYGQLLSVDSQADWYLHHSHKLLIAGSQLTPGARPSRVSLEWLIDLLTPNYVRQRRH